MTDDITIRVENLVKAYHIYDHPRSRLKQFVLPPLQKLVGLAPRHYYREFLALNNVSLEVRKGETVGILGRNGSGKSTLLQIIAGTLAPTSGEVNISGVLAALLELGSGFNREFTGRENIYLNGNILGFSSEEMNKLLDEIISFADIGEHLDQPIKTYSSGMVVRLAFAVQACVSPQILIVDEALSVGDEKFQRKCFDYIERLRERGCSILLVTHSTATVEKFCQRGLLLHNGQVHGVGPAKEIVDQYHALLYSDEKGYLRYLNQQQRCDEVHVTASQLIKNQRTDTLENSGVKDSSDIRAIITGWVVLDTLGGQSEQFRTGDILKIIFFVDVLSDIDEVQAGILIRTIEGVSAFGTSTLYHKKNYINAKQGNQLKFEFELHANLCAGSYFVTLAIAEAVSHGDMLYLDKKTDIIVIKLHQPRVMASGIAMLDAKVSVNQVGMNK